MRATCCEKQGAADSPGGEFATGQMVAKVMDVSAEA